MAKAISFSVTVSIAAAMIPQLCAHKDVYFRIYGRHRQKRIPFEEDVAGDERLEHDIVGVKFDGLVFKGELVKGTSNEVAAPTFHQLNNFLAKLHALRVNLTEEDAVLERKPGVTQFSSFG